MELMNTAEVSATNEAPMTKKQEQKIKAKEERKAAINNAFAEAVAQDPNFTEKCGTASDTIIVKKAFVTSKVKGLEEVKKDGTRTTAVIPGVAGYELQNVGSAPIVVSAKRWAQGADGIYVATVEEITVAPKASVILTKADTTRLASNTEYGLEFANGKIVAGSHVKSDTPEEALAAYYVKFKEGTVADHSESLDDKNGNLVKHLDAFGYLLNPAPAKERKQREKKADNTRAALTAFVQSLREAD